MTARYAVIAGGAPSSVSGLTDHLAHETLKPEQAALAAYYQHGGAAHDQIGIVRQDCHPIVMRGLGLDDGERLTNKRIDGIMSGHTAQGEKIEGKTYSVRRGEPNHTGSIVFSPAPHKSVSVAWGLAPPVEQAMIYNAHVTAARDYMAFVAAELGQIRVGKGGEDGRVPGHVGWVEFTHHTSRRTATVVRDGGVHFEKIEAAGDMDLHTHFVVPATTWAEDGRVGSLDTKCLSLDFCLAADAVYHAAISRELRAAGLGVALDETRGPVGAARVTSVPQEMADVFSKRTNAGLALARMTAKARGEDWDSLSAEQIATRVHNATQDKRQKSLGGKDDVANVADWQRQCKDVGWDIPQTFLAPEHERAVDVTHEQRIRKAYEIALPSLDLQFQQRAVISAWDLHRAASAGLTAAGYRDLSDVDAVVDLMRREGVLHDGQKTRLIEGQEPDRRYRSVTTHLHEAQEREFVALAKSAAADRRLAATPEQVDRAAEASGLNFADEHGRAQLRAVHTLGEGGAYGVLIGRDGAGKSAMLKVMTSVWAEQGRTVLGASLAWEQAEAMTDGGIPKTNVKAFSVLLNELNGGGLTLSRHDVVAVDEMGQIGTRQMLDLLRHREAMGFTLIGLGDNRQCSAIEAGEIISLSRRALGADAVPEILTTVRQQTEREREIVTHFRENRPDRAIAMKREDGAAHMVMGGAGATINAVADRYKAKLLETGTAPLVLTDLNADAHAISAAIRSERRGLGLIGPDLVTIKATDREKQRTIGIAKGDHVRLFNTVGCTLENGRGGRIGRNRSVAEVLDADAKGMTIKLTKDGTIGRVRWSDMTDVTGAVELAWAGALTAYSGQGKTADHVIEAYPSGSTTSDGRNSFVKESRHRMSSEIIVNAMAERAAVRQSRPINDTRDITPDDQWDHFAKRLTASPPKALATAMIDRADALRRGAVKSFHQAMHPAEQRMRDGEQPSMAPERMEVERASRLSPLQQVVDIAHQIREYVSDKAQQLAQHMHTRITQADRDWARQHSSQQEHEQTHRHEQDYSHGLEM